jgi:hypothetical protein
MIEQLIESNGAIIKKRSLSNQLVAKKGNIKPLQCFFWGQINILLRSSFNVRYLKTFLIIRSMHGWVDQLAIEPKSPFAQKNG